MIRVGLACLLLCVVGNGLVTLRAAETVSVEVVDADGQRIDEAEGMWWRNRRHQHVRSEQGAFSLSERTGLLAVRAKGYQYAGIVFDAETPPTPSITLLRDGEIDRRQLPVRPIPVSQALRDKLLSILTTRGLQDIDRAANDSEQATPTKLLVKLAPQKTFELLQNGKLQGNATSIAKQSLIREFAKSDLSKAISLIDREEDPMYRSMSMLLLVRSLDDEHPQRAAVESQSVDAIRNSPQPAMRLAGWATLAEHYQLTGRPELATKIVAQQMEDVKKLPGGGWSGYPRSLFAALVVESDPDLAAQLIDGLADHERSRALGRLAFHCCRSNPQRAQDFLDSIVRGRAVGDPFHIKVVHRMATAHPRQAVELAQSLEDPKQRGWALGMASRALAESSPALAQESLQLAINAIEESANAKLRTFIAPSELLAALMTVAEECAPERLRSLLWQSVWLAAPQSRWSDGADLGFQVESTAASLARYDARIARALYGSPPKNFTDRYGQLRRDAAINKLVLDPKGLTAWFENQGSLRGSADGYGAVVELLSASPEEFWDVVSLPYVMEWPTEAFEEL